MEIELNLACYASSKLTNTLYGIYTRSISEKLDDYYAEMQLLGMIEYL